MDSSGVATRLRQWLSVKTVIKIAIHYSDLKVTVLQVLYDNFIGSFLFFFATQALRTWLRVVVPDIVDRISATNSLLF